jgi:hypothetical protein
MRLSTDHAPTEGVSTSVAAATARSARRVVTVVSLVGEDVCVVEALPPTSVPDTVA